MVKPYATQHVYSACVVCTRVLVVVVVVVVHVVVDQKFEVESLFAIFLESSE